MSPLHPDRLPTEGAATDQDTSATLDPAPGKTSRRATGTAPVTTSPTTRPGQRRGTLSTGSAAPASSGRGRTAREVTATVARTATATAARATSATATAKAKAKAAGTGARAAMTTATAACATAAARRAASAEPTAVPRPRASRATPKPPAVKAPAPESAAVKAAAVKAAAVKAPAAETPAVRRPTPIPRTPQEVPSTAATGPAVEDVVLPAQSAAARPGPLSRVLRHPPPSVRRRPSLYLAAALVTVIGVGGGLSSAGPAAQAGTETAGSSISVAEQLGIPADAAAPIIDAETTDRLGELVASRAERDAEQSQAARVQATADRAAAEAQRRAAAAAAEAARPKAVRPVDGARLTSAFGARWGTLHAGIDLAAPMRTPEYAVMDGVVLEAGPASGFGLAVYIQHENGDVTVYGHMDEILVSAGQVVKAGETIALLGNTGQSTGPHLHFEVHQGGLGGTKIDPVPWLLERGVEL